MSAMSSIIRQILQKATRPGGAFASLFDEGPSPASSTSAPKVKQVRAPKAPKLPQAETITLVHAPSVPGAKQKAGKVKTHSNPTLSLFDEMLHPRAEYEMFNPETGQIIKPGQFATKPGGDDEKQRKSRKRGRTDNRERGASLFGDDEEQPSADVVRSGEQTPHQEEAGTGRTDKLQERSGESDTGRDESARGAGDSGEDVPDPTRPDIRAESGRGPQLTQSIAADIHYEQPAPIPAVLPNFSAPTKVGNDFRITEEHQIGKGGVKQKFKDNVVAITLLKEIEGEGRKATPEEQAILARYTGWGWGGQIFHPNNDEEDSSRWNTWKREHDVLRELMTDEEFESAKGSTTNAHYTAPSVINHIWNAMRRLGFKDGKVLEPGAGIGNFFGAMPADMWGQSAVTAVELDDLSARFAAQLYQSSNVIADGFQNAPLPNGYFDLAISNVPFGNYPVFDKVFEAAKLGWLTKSLHNYFFAKSLTKVRAGGMIAFITSSWTMDSRNAQRVREYLAANADLVGAIRLPSNAFKENAGTEVTTDIIILRKREPKERPGGESWARSLSMPDPAGGEAMYVNEYFQRHPEMMMGEMSRTGGKYEDEANCVLPKDKNLSEELGKAVANLPENLYTPRAGAYATDTSVIAVRGQNVGNYLLDKNGTIMQVEPGELIEIGRDENGAPVMERTPNKIEPVPIQTGLVAGRRRALIKLRDYAVKLLAAQINPALSEEEVEAHRQTLNTIYDDFVKKNGFVHQTGNLRAFAKDPDLGLLCALEEYDPDTKVAKKSDIFSKRTNNPEKPSNQADSVGDGLLHSLNMYGGINVGYIASMVGKSPEEVQHELSEGGFIYHNPGGDWEPADQYLAGNVRKKLAEAQAAAGLDPRYQKNVEALQKVQPEDLMPADIGCRLGTGWVPPEVFSSFVNHLCGIEDGSQGVKFKYLQGQAAWNLHVTDTGFSGRNTSALRTRWGTDEKSALDLISLSMNMQKPTIWKTDSEGNRYVDKEASQEAHSKMKEIEEEFNNWIYQDDDRAIAMAKIYNETCNTDVLRRYDGSHLTIPGFNELEKMNLNAHVKDCVWRILQSDNSLMDLAVGGGKTWIGTIAAMELRRLGIARKPMVCVPNHLIPQWNDAIQRLYPNAKVLMCTKADFDTQKRRALLARIATGDYDTILISHSQLGLIPMTPETEDAFFNKQIKEIEDTLKEHIAEGGDQDPKKDPTTKELVKARERMVAKLEKRQKKRKERADDPIPFEHLGVDHIIVDESHEFKRLPFATKMTRIKGISPEGSDKAFDLFMKTQHIQGINNGRGVTFMTGTPLTNTLAEMYTIQRFLDGKRLEEAGLQHFDAWASTFGTTSATIEQTADGKLKPTERFNRFFNLPELMTMYSRIAEVKLASDMKLPVPDADRIAVSCRPSEAQKQYVKLLDLRGDEIRAGKVKPWEDNMPAITTDGRLNSLDVRLRQPGATENPTSKANMVAHHVHDVWSQTHDNKATQLVFLDLSTPKSGLADLDDLTEVQKARKWGSRLGGPNKKFAAAWLKWHLASEKQQQQDAEDEEIFETTGKRPKRKKSEVGEEPAPEWFTIKEEGKGDEEPIYHRVQNADFIRETLRNTVTGEVNPFATDQENDEEKGLRTSVYEDIRSKMTAKGIPPEQIAFIHDADTDEKKKVLFRRVKEGDVRVLVGSTAKMGTGMNVQDRLVALHHVDCPWRPDQLEQREGRILRKGNMHKDVKIYNYLTQAEDDAMSTDAFMWQTVESKARMIGQVRANRTGARTTEDIGDMTLTYAQLKAIAANNPLLMEHAAANHELQELEIKAKSHDRAQWAAKHKIRELPQSIANDRKRLTGLQGAMQHIQPKPEKFTMELQGQSVEEFSKAGDAIAAISTHMAPGLDPVKVGNYRGLDIYVAPDPFAGTNSVRSLHGIRPETDLDNGIQFGMNQAEQMEAKRRSDAKITGEDIKPAEEQKRISGIFYLAIPGQSGYVGNGDFNHLNSGSGAMGRIASEIAAIPGRAERLSTDVENKQKHYQDLQKEIRPFPHMEKLTELRAKVRDLVAKLGVDKEDEGQAVIVDENGNFADAPPDEDGPSKTSSAPVAAAPASVHHQDANANGYFIHDAQTSTGWKEVKGEHLKDFDKFSVGTGSHWFAHAEKNGSYYTYSIVDAKTGALAASGTEKTLKLAKENALHKAETILTRIAEEKGIPQSLQEGAEKRGYSPYKGGQWQDLSRATAQKKRDVLFNQAKTELDKRTGSFHQDPEVRRILQGNESNARKRIELISHFKRMLPESLHEDRGPDVFEWVVSQVEPLMKDYKAGKLAIKDFPDIHSEGNQELLHGIVQQMLQDPYYRRKYAMEQHVINDVDPITANHNGDYRAQSFYTNMDRALMDKSVKVGKHVAFYDQYMGDPAFQRHVREYLRPVVMDAIEKHNEAAADSSPASPSTTAITDQARQGFREGIQQAQNPNIHVVGIPDHSAGASQSNTAPTASAVAPSSQPEPAAPPSSPGELKGVRIKRNRAQDGVEVRFDNKPSSDVISQLKNNGFRWSNANRVWYKRYSTQAEAAAIRIAQQHSGAIVKAVVLSKEGKWSGKPTYMKEQGVSPVEAIQPLMAQARSAFRSAAGKVKQASSGGFSGVKTAFKTGLKVPSLVKPKPTVNMAHVGVVHDIATQSGARHWNSSVAPVTQNALGGKTDREYTHYYTHANPYMQAQKMQDEYEKAGHTVGEIGIRKVRTEQGGIQHRYSFKVTGPQGHTHNINVFRGRSWPSTVQAPTP